jgi:hypothetical protein
VKTVYSHLHCIRYGDNSTGVHDDIDDDDVAVTPDMSSPTKVSGSFTQQCALNFKATLKLSITHIWAGMFIRATHLHAHSHSRLHLFIAST